MIVEAEGYRFDFPDADSAFKFDETDSNLPTFHGAPMKAVDLIVEYSSHDHWIEIKQHQDGTKFDPFSGTGAQKVRHQEHLHDLKESLKLKARDTYLYRHAEGKVDKPIYYSCLLPALEAPLCLQLAKMLERELPIGRKPARWKRALFESCHVLNLDTWSKVFPKASVLRLL